MTPDKEAIMLSCLIDSGKGHLFSLHDRKIIFEAMESHSEELRKENEELMRINETVILDRNLYRESFEKLQLTIDEKNKEIERLKGLLIAMFKLTPRYNDCGSPATAMAELNRFKTENNL